MHNHIKFFFIISALLAVSACESMPSWLGGAEKEIKRLPGERVDALGFSAELKADPAVGQIVFNLPVAYENTNWPQGNGIFTAAAGNLKLSGDLSTSQTAQAGDGHEFEHSLAPRPVIANGKLYTMDAAGNISAHNLDDIKQKLWISDTLTGNDDNEIIGGGLAAEQGNIYAVSGLGKVAALDAESGKTLWSRDLGTPLRSAPRAGNGKIFVISIDSQLFALDAASGTTLWTHRGIAEGAGMLGNISPALVADSVIAPYASGELYSIKADDGQEAWRVSLVQTKRSEATAIFSGIGGDPVIDESVVFAVSNSGMFSVFNILNGQPLWDKKIASINTPWLAGDYIFALSEDNILLAMVKYNGSVRWATQLPRFKDEKRRLYPIVWRGPLMADGKLIIVSDHGEMRLVNSENGADISIISIADEIMTAPIIANGKLFIVGKDATIYSYK